MASNLTFLTRDGQTIALVDGKVDPSISGETHMQLWARLAQGMRHGTPGMRKGKSRG